MIQLGEHNNNACVTKTKIIYRKLQGRKIRVEPRERREGKIEKRDHKLTFELTLNAICTCN